MSQALRKLAGAINRSNCAVVFINQLREKIGVMFGNPETTTGGKALKFYASLRLDIRRIGPVKERETVIGNHVRVKVVKNKVAPPFRQAEFDIMFDEGISHTSLLVDLASEANIIQKSGAWYSYSDQRIGQGRENAKLFLRDNPPLMTEVEGKVKELLGVRPVAAGAGARRTRAWTTAPDHRARCPSPGAPGAIRIEVDGARFGAVAREVVRGGAAPGGPGARRGAAGAARRRADVEAAYRTALRALERRSFARARPRAAGSAGRGTRARRSRRRSSAAASSGSSTMRHSPATMSRPARRRGRGPLASRAISWPWGSSGASSTVRSRAHWPEGPMPPAMPHALAAKRAAQLGDLPRHVKRRRGCSPIWRAGGSAGGR